MPEETIVRYNTRELKDLNIRGNHKTDWQRVYEIKDEDIIYDEDSIELKEEMFTKAALSEKRTRKVRLSLDLDMLEWYKREQIAYKSLINNMLRSYMEAHRC